MTSNSVPINLWVLAASVLVSTLVGFKLGQKQALVEATQAHTQQQQQQQGHKPEDKKEDNDDEEDDDARADGELGSVTTTGPCKLVLVVRTDLGMTKGKIAAQCGHATLACYKTIAKANPRLLSHWEWTGQAKIAVQVSSEEDLLLLQASAQSLNLVARVIQDAGRTQIASGSRTVLGIGPGPVDLINQVTGHLKLL
ncbi:hypothetical protein FRC15_004568 [Serendipita sp. 397]|nr:hypothetical protein FRC15_004568 [Serendipita sp. 397]